MLIFHDARQSTHRPAGFVGNYMMTKPKSGRIRTRMPVCDAAGDAQNRFPDLEKSDEHQQPTIIYTLTDEAPLLATSAFLPIIRTFTAPAGIDVTDQRHLRRRPHPGRVPGIPDRGATGARQPGRTRPPDAAARHQHHQAAQHQRLGASVGRRDQGTAGQGLQDAGFPRGTEDRRRESHPPALLQVPGQRRQSGAARGQLGPPRARRREELRPQEPAQHGRVEHGFAHPRGPHEARRLLPWRKVHDGGQRPRREDGTASPKR